MLKIDPSVNQEFEKSLPIDLHIPPTKNIASKNDWSSAYFRMVPTVATLTILSKFQNDVKNSEALIVDFCHRKVGEVEVVYDQFEAIASQSSQYLMPGQELTITGGVGAFNSKAQPTVTIDGANIPINAQGVAEYKTTVGGPGSYTKKVHISFKKPDGTIGGVDKDIQYTVGSPTGASVSADAVKVLYKDLDNPITVSGGNVGDEKVSVTMTNGTLTKTGPGKYIVRPARAGTPAVITVNADGKSTPFEFRVKDVPDPVAKVGLNKGGPTPVNDFFKAQAGVRADLEKFLYF